MIRASQTLWRALRDRGRAECCATFEFDFDRHHRGEFIDLEVGREESTFGRIRLSCCQHLAVAILHNDANHFATIRADSLNQESTACAAFYAMEEGMGVAS